MNRLVIAAPSANCGKTELACRLLRASPGVQVLKITRFHRESSCPVPGVGDSCDGCDPAPAGFEIVDDPERLATPGKDTDRLARAGGEPVLWLRAAPDAFSAAIREAIGRFDPGRPLLIEGNSAAVVGDLETRVAVIWPQSPRGVKSSVLPALRRADFLLLVECPDSPHRRMPPSLRRGAERAGLSANRLPEPIWLTADWWRNGQAAPEALQEALGAGRALA